MKKLALLALSVACAGMASAIGVTYTGVQNPTLVTFRTATGTENVYATMINFKLSDGTDHSGFCLTPDRWIQGNWQADVSLVNDKIGYLINQGASNYHPGYTNAVWQAAAQVAIWEYGVSLLGNTTVLGNGGGEYDWMGITVNWDIQNCLNSKFGYAINSTGTAYVLDDQKLQTATYRKYTAIRNSQGLSQDLGERTVPGPAAAVPFALGFFAALKRKRK